MKAAISSVSHKLVSLFRKAGSLFLKVGSLSRMVGSLLRRVGSFFHNVVSLLERLVQKLRALPPFRWIDRAFQRAWKGARPSKYHFLLYVTSVLRVLGWAVLIIGVLASMLLGLEIMNGGLMVWETELKGVDIGVSAIVLGTIGSFLAWLFSLVGRELVCLFIHVKENTRNTVESIAEKSS